MEFVSVCSKSDLSELQYLLGKKIPANHFIFIKKTNQNTILFDKRYIKKFLEIAISWINKNLCRKKIEDILQNTCQFEPDEYLFLCQKLIEKTDCNLLREEICNKMSNILFLNDKMNLDGFFIFALKEYNKKVEEIIYKNLNSVIIENNYENFINLIKEYIDTEESLIKTMYIEAQVDGTCKFSNEEHKDISQACINIFEIEFGKIEEYDDLLLSTLVIFLPKKIFIYKYKLIQNKNILHTLKKIFGSRITFYDKPIENKRKL